MIYRTDHCTVIANRLHVWRTYDQGTSASHARQSGRQQLTELVAPRSQFEYAIGFTIEVPGIAAPRPPTEIATSEGDA